MPSKSSRHRYRFLLPTLLCGVANPGCLAAAFMAWRGNRLNLEAVGTVLVLSTTLAFLGLRSAVGYRLDNPMPSPATRDRCTGLLVFATTNLGLAVGLWVLALAIGAFRMLMAWGNSIGAAH